MRGFVRRPRRWIELACRGVSVVFCMIASVTVAVASKDWLEEIVGDGAGMIGLVALIIGWIGGGKLFGRQLLNWWDAGRKRRVGVILVLLAATVPVLLLVAIPNIQRPWQRFDAVFGPHAGEYFARTRTGPQVGPNRIRGRCVVVSDKGVETWMMSDLPRRLRAETEVEVRSVVQMRSEREPLQSPEGAWEERLLVTILDADTGRALADEVFKGKWRQVRPKGGTPFWTGAVESNVVPAFLRDLPHEKE